jgi:hypothetical protein
MRTEAIMTQGKPVKKYQTASIRQFAHLPADVQQEVLDFMNYVAARRGIKLDSPTSNQPRWLSRVNRGIGTGEAISDSVILARAEERW